MFNRAIAKAKVTKLKQVIQQVKVSMVVFILQSAVTLSNTKYHKLLFLYPMLAE